MSIPIKVPPLGESVTSAILIQWLKNEGEAVAILRDMATGHPDAQPTEAARDSLERLGKSGRVR